MGILDLCFSFLHVSCNLNVFRISKLQSIPSALQAWLGQSRAAQASVSSCKAKAEVLCQILQSKRVTVGPYSPRLVLLESYQQSSPVICSPHPSSAVLINLLQSSLCPITCRARPSSRVTWKMAPPVKPAARVPTSQSESRAFIWKGSKIHVHPGRPFTYS